MPSQVILISIYYFDIATQTFNIRPMLALLTAGRDMAMIYRRIATATASLYWSALE